jgi:hypothetical protein
MPDLIAISQGLNAIKATTEIVKTIIGLRDSAKLLEQAVELNQKILSVQAALVAAQQEQTTLVETIREREEEIVRLKNWETEKQRYEMRDISGSGAIAYLIKPENQGTEPVHCLCANCYQNAKKSILQNTIKMNPPYGRIWACPNCKSEITIRQWPPAAANV